jgi:hypothetical protein
VFTDSAVQIDVVTCQLDGQIYVRKSLEKHFALRAREVVFVAHHVLFILRNFYSNALPNWNEIFFCAQNTSALRGLRDYFVHFRLPLILILLWIMPKEARYGMYLSQALVKESLRQTYFGGLLRQFAPSTGVIPKVSSIGESPHFL